MYAIILAFVTALVLAYNVLPSVIYIALKRGLYDKPNVRSSHFTPTPSLGGVGIFVGSICGVILWTPEGAFGSVQYILAAMLVIAFIGLKDDLVSISPSRKAVGQLFAAFILVYKSDLVIDNLGGLFGIEQIPYAIAFPFTMFAIVGIINAYNLIDGINGLAGGIGLITCLFFGSWFFKNGHIGFAILAFSLAGSLVSFMKFNITPSRIFMGDTGSLLVGLLAAVFAIKFIQVQQAGGDILYPYAYAAPAIAVSVLILPLFDTARVFIRRMMAGKSPFYPDKTHIHHLCLDLGLSHSKASALLHITNLCIIGIVVFFHKSLGINALFLLVLGLISAFVFVLSRLAKRKKKLAVAPISNKKSEEKSLV